MATAITACAFSLALRHNATRIALSRERHDPTNPAWCPVSEVRLTTQTSKRTSETKGHQQNKFAGAASDLKFQSRFLGKLCRNFKSAALVITLH
jgi:hypothetical protein